MYHNKEETGTATGTGKEKEQEQKGTKNRKERKAKGMKKIRAILLGMLLAIVMPCAVRAATGPAEFYDPKAKDEAVGAWSYIKVAPVSGARSKTHYVFSNYETTTLPKEGVIEAVEGMVYDKATNTLNVTNYKQEDIVLSIHNMGTELTLNLEGENELRSVKVDKDLWDSGLIISGTGTTVLGNTSDHNRVPLELYGNLELLSGTVTCLAEVSSVQSAEGDRYAFLMTSTDKIAVKTMVGCSVALDSVETSSGSYLIRTRENITFGGEALAAPEIKRKGKKVTWSKIDGATYEVSVNGEIQETQKTMVKAGKKKKVSVRAIKVDGFTIMYSPWSKLV